MSNLVISLIAGSALIIMVLCGVLGFLYNRSRLLALELAAVRGQMTKLMAVFPQIKKQQDDVSIKVEWLERSFFDVRDQVDKHSLTGGNQVAYSQAARLIGRGESIETLIDVCGLSRAEAELLLKMHQSKQQKPTGAVSRM